MNRSLQLERPTRYKMNAESLETTKTKVPGRSSTYRYRMKSERINKPVPIIIAYFAIFILFLFLIVIAHISVLYAATIRVHHVNATIVTNSTLVTNTTENG